MSAANKILTVSYGTFSCTIEGFEDPFGTMKQIAEYFRDLAAEDRYFGAEPPVPDAEALRHIAERETARRVEARMASGAVHLRRIDDAAAAASATPVVSAAPLVSGAPPSPAPAAVLTPSEVIDPAPSSAPSSVAERLSRIRAVVARARTQPLWPDDDALVPAFDQAAPDARDNIAPADEFLVTPPPVARPAAPAESDGDALADLSGSRQDTIHARTDDASPVPQDAAVVADPAPSERIGAAESDMLSDMPTAAAETAAAETAEQAPAPTPAAAASPEAPLPVHADAPAAADTTSVEDAEVAPPAAESPVLAGAVDDSITEDSLTDETPVDAALVAALDLAAPDLAAPDLAAEPAQPADPEASARVIDAWTDPALSDTDRPVDHLIAAWDIPAVAAEEYVRPELPVARIAVLRKEDHAAASATGQLEDLLSGRIDASGIYEDEEVAPAAASPSEADDRLLDAIRAVGAAARDSDHGSDVAVGTGDEPAVADADGTATWADDDADRSLDWTGPALTDDPALDGDWRHGAPSHGALRLDADWRADDADPIPAEAHALTASAQIDAGPDAGRPDAEQADRDDFLDLDADDEDPLLLQTADDADRSERAKVPGGSIDDEPALRAGHDQAVEDLERRPEDASVDRLLAATNSQLESTEVNRRRSAIAHLKAAVAAARADRQTDEPAEPVDAPTGSALDRFREDLARVVRPRRPVDQDQARPSRRLPPLMLVSEQRIDVGPVPTRNEDAMAGPVRPRRVVTRDVGDEDVALPATAAPGGFADFAESMGARDLTDMIEAAAAYTAFVEGRPSFSRPQLMQMMRAGDSEDDAFSREEQLRSFGLLLRQGRIQKLKRGQFTVADDTRFRPTHRHAGE